MKKKINDNVLNDDDAMDAIAEAVFGDNDDDAPLDEDAHRKAREAQTTFIRTTRQSAIKVIDKDSESGTSGDDDDSDDGEEQLKTKTATVAHSG